MIPPPVLIKAKQIVVKCTELDEFTDEINHIKNGMHLPKTSTLVKLTPYLDNEGVLRVGGRLGIVLAEERAHPMILPKHHHVTTLIIRHYHQQVQHQGRHLTHGRIRSEGFWIIGGKRSISKEIGKCVVCKKQRGKQETQKMADLPKERLTSAPPFTYVGLDVFGPWMVRTRRTRGGQANGNDGPFCLLAYVVGLSI
ncbi:uncharacterized protein [Antedon mediterranea]|uniref:uncharacterized protein n=1 Tax=Antedon mediterranea TaxID=105859 RepID=UPI003AF973A5